VCQETIYGAICHGGRGGLSRQLTRRLRTGRPLLGHAAREAGPGGRNTAAIDALASADVVGAVFVPFAFVVAVIVTTTWARIERRRSVHNPARLVYLGSTAVPLVVLAVEPVVGFVGYVGRPRRGVPAGGAVADRAGCRTCHGGRPRRGRRPAHRQRRHDRPLCRRRRRPDRGAPRLRRERRHRRAIALSLGGLHLLFDGFIWRSASGRQRGHGAYEDIS
jgi:hypothetical protein